VALSEDMFNDERRMPPTVDARTTPARWPHHHSHELGQETLECIVDQKTLTDAKKDSESRGTRSPFEVLEKKTHYAGNGTEVRSYRVLWTIETITTGVSRELPPGLRRAEEGDYDPLRNKMIVPAFRKLATVLPKPREFGKCVLPKDQRYFPLLNEREKKAVRRFVYAYGLPYRVGIGAPFVDYWSPGAREESSDVNTVLALCREVHAFAAVESIISTPNVRAARGHYPYWWEQGPDGKWATVCGDVARYLAHAEDWRAALKEGVRWAVETLAERLKGIRLMPLVKAPKEEEGLPVWETGYWYGTLYDALWLRLYLAATEHGGTVRKCLRCGDIFVDKRLDAKYCSDGCRWAADKREQRRRAKAAAETT